MRFHLPGKQMRVQIKLHKLRIVVEHLLEMRHQPIGIDRIAREAAAENADKLLQRQWSDFFTTGDPAKAKDKLPKAA